MSETICGGDRDAEVFASDRRGEGDPKGWFTVLITALGSWGKPVTRGHMIRGGDPRGWSTVLITSLGSWEKK